MSKIKIGDVLKTFNGDGNVETLILKIKLENKKKKLIPVIGRKGSHCIFRNEQR